MGLVTLVITSTCCVVSGFALSRLVQPDGTNEALTTSSGNDCNITVKRGQMNLLRPLMFVDNPNPSERLSPVKQNLAKIIQEQKEKGNITSASVFLRDFNTLNWIEINDEESYTPASLFKVPFMMVYLKMSEKNPGLLNKKINYPAPYEDVSSPQFDDSYITPGKSYTVRELIEAMIIHSDNHAAYLLAEQVDETILADLFSSVGLTAPRANSVNTSIRASQYSYFFRILLNGAYLTQENCNYAMSLLTKTTFHQGFSAGLPQDVLMAHKFGEGGNQNMKELHETGIIYMDNRPYLLTVMSKGRDMKTLASFLQQMSSATYQGMQQL